MNNFCKLFGQLFFFTTFLITSFSCNYNHHIQQADVIIYGGTSAAVIAAVEVIRSGKTAIIVSPDIHLGGISSSGLGSTDIGSKSTIGGLSREFYHRVWLYYNDATAWNWQKKSDYGNKGIDSINQAMWIFEPHVAEQVFEKFIFENNITVFRDEWLNRKTGVELKSKKITSITTLSGKKYTGKVFIDASYEGDLMATAGVSYHVGRESCSQYGEKWNGVQKGVFHHGHYFKNQIDPYLIPGNPSSGLLPKISAATPGENGGSDNKVQAYCFRLCMTKHHKNRVPFSKPENYDTMQYELLARVFDTGCPEWFKKFSRIPNRKTDTNNHGPYSSDNIGMNYKYPDATYEQRKEIIKEHKNYQKGLLYFVSNDPRVPEEIREEMKLWGLAKDEFTDNNNWPYQLYVREARRMKGQFVTTENEVLGKTHITNPVGMGSYSMDSHNVQRYVTDEGYVQNEGDLGIHPPHPYQIAYGSLIPKAEECVNLIVPVCVSSSHIAYGSIRMEPVFMALGQSAAVAATLSIDNNCPVQLVSYPDLEKVLKMRGQVLSITE